MIKDENTGLYRRTTINSSPDTVAAQTRLLLTQLTVDLQTAAVWSSHPPSAQAMASTAPFACDTMPLENWLQFILIPRLSEMLDSKQPLPGNIAIAPMAEQMFAGQQAMLPVIETLRELDSLLSEQPQC